MMCSPSTKTATITLNQSAVSFSPLNFDAQIGMGGYAFPYDDGLGSVACLNSTLFCAGGSVVAAPASGAAFAGIGVNLNQLPGSMGAAPFYTPTGKSGVMYALTNAPGKFEMVVQNGTANARFHAQLTAASGMVPWASFMAEVPDAGPPALTGPPSTQSINFQIDPSTAARTFDFCVTTLAFY